jgi:predicted membrane-bound spermidine synthase
MIGFYHSDGPAVVASPLSRVVIDDGRRYLERTTERYDVITIDPPPPVEAAGSSLLYSEEFYQIAKRRLRPGGILQQWFPSEGADVEVIAAVARSLRNSFPNVRTFEDEFGFHFLCSEQPLPQRTAAELLQRLPANALIDFAEWADPTPNGALDADLLQFQTLLDHEVSLEKLIALSPNTPALTDDRPINEYYVVRRTLRRWRRQIGG